MKKFFLSKSVFLICATLFCYILWRYMTKVALEWLGLVDPSQAASYCILALFLVTGCFFITFVAEKKEKLVSSFLIAYIGIIVTTIIHSFDEPLKSGILPFEIILPTLLMYYLYVLFQLREIEAFHRVVFIIVFVIMVVGIFRNITTVAFMSSSDEYVTSVSYTILFLFPPILCMKNKYVRIASVIVIAIALFLSNKRVGLLAFAISLLVYFVVITKQSAPKRRLLILVSAVIVLFSVGPYIYTRVQDSFLFDRFENLSEDRGSNRDEVYKNTISIISESDFNAVLLGHGWNAVSKYSGISAHNDFLEVIYDCGWLVFLFYFTFIIRLLVYSVQLYRKNSKYAGPMAVSVIIFLIHSSFSHILLYPEYMMSFALFWGMVVGNNRRMKLLKM